MDRATRNRAARDKARAEGKCIVCCCRPTEGGKSCCEHCLQRRREYDYNSCKPKPKKKIQPSDTPKNESAEDKRRRILRDTLFPWPVQK